jgi:hypothetical protein
VREAFRKRGHEAWSCDIKPAEDGSIYHIQADIRALLNPVWKWPWDLMIAHPDCTYLTNSGVRWLHDIVSDSMGVFAGGVKVPNRERWNAMLDAIEFYKFLWNQPIPRICIENPVMHGYARNRMTWLPKRQFVQPWQFGEPMFKRTGYSLKNLPLLKPTTVLTPPEAGTPEHKAWSWVHRCPPGPERKTIRSRTPLGIAEAMAEQWGNLP